MKVKFFILVLYSLATARFSEAQTQNCCISPVASAASYITSTSAKLYWGCFIPQNCPDPIKFQIRYKVANSTIWQYTQKPYLVVGLHTKWLQNLLPGTYYIYQVRTVCSTSGGGTTHSSWSNESPFMTAQRVGSFIGKPVTSVFPNPGADQLNIVLENVSAEVVTLTMMNLLGQPVAVQTLNDVDGLLNADLNTSALPSGNYFLVLKYNDEQQVMKWIKD